VAVTENDVQVGPVTPAQGVTTISVDFLVPDAAHLAVYKTGSETPLILDTDYTFAGVGTASGTVTLTVAADGEDAYTVRLEPPFERPTDLQFRGSFTSGPFNTELDNVWQALQSLKSSLAGAFRTSRTAAAMAPLAEAATDRASRVLAFDAQGNPVAGPLTQDLLDGVTGPQGPTGPAGADGEDGSDGLGVPTGGTTGQVLQKTGGGDYATGWLTLGAGAQAAALAQAVWVAGTSTVEAIVSPAKIKAAIDAVVGTLEQAVWETGTSTTEAIVSPAKVKAAIDALGASNWNYETQRSLTAANEEIFTGLAGAVEIEVTVSGMVTGSNGGFLNVQIGGVSSIASSGYVPASAFVGSSGGFGALAANGFRTSSTTSGLTYHIGFRLRAINAARTRWVCEHNGRFAGAANGVLNGYGEITLGEALTRLRAFSDDGTNWSASGTIDLRWR
jgi:hypothetical protein